MESAVSTESSGAGPPTEVGSNTSTSNNENACGDAAVYADMSGDNFEEIILSCSESEAWVQPSSTSCLTNQGGAVGSSYPRTSGEFSSLPSYSNISSNMAVSQQQGPGAPPPTATATLPFGTATRLKDHPDSRWVVINTLKREVFATAALLRALRMHAAAQTRGISAATQQQLAAAVAPLVKSFELLSERLAAAEAAKEPPPAELQEQHIHPFLFVLAQQQLHHRQQQGLSKQQQQLQQSCIRALASAVLRSLDHLLTVGLSRCHSSAGRRCLHALILALTNCVLQAAQRLLSAPTQPTSANAAAAAAAAALASEAYGGSLFAPASPAAEEELLLLQCLDLLTSSLLGPAGHVFSDTCVARTIQCCVAVSLMTRASPLLRNAAAARAVAITRHLFAFERLTLLFQQQQQAEDGTSPPQQKRRDPEEQQSQQRASPPHQFMARLGSALSLRSLEGGHSPSRQPAAKTCGLECRQRFLTLLGGLLSLEEPHPAGSSIGSGSNSSGVSRRSSLPPFVSPPEAGTSPSLRADCEGTPEQKDILAKQGKDEEGLQTAGPAAALGGANPVSAVSGLRDTSRPAGLPGLDRDFECVLGNHVKDKVTAVDNRLFCLRLLSVALEAGKESICLFPSLLRPLQAQILPVVLQQDTRSAPLLLLSLTLRVLGNFIVYLRPYIKNEMERCLYQLLRLSISAPGAPPRTVLASEAQEIALDMVRELCSDDSFGIELLLNYDCDIRRSNVFGVLLALLMQLAAPRVPAPRGSYRPTCAALDGGQGLVGGVSVPSSPQRAALTSPTASDVASSKVAQQHLPPSAAQSPVSSNQFADGSKMHHHVAFHLRRTPQRAPLKGSRSSADSSTAAATAGAETQATDAAGVTRPAGLSTVNRLALAAIIRLISSLATRCDSLKRSNSRNSKHRQQQPTDAPHLEAESAAAYFLRIQSKQPLAQRRKNKATLCLGAASFNANSKDAVSQLEGLGLVSNPSTPKSMALFLKDTKGLDLRTVGLYLSTNKQWNVQVLKEFVRLFSFTGVGLVAALRDFLRTFRLPGESQQIERVMEAFADEYFRQQPLANCPHNDKLATDATVAQDAPGEKGTKDTAEPLELSMWRWVVDEGFYCTSRANTREERDGDQTEALKHQKSREALTKELSEFGPTRPPQGYVLMLHKDTVFILSYSIIMLNTDQHNSQVRNKMKVEDFLKNNRGINNGSDLPSFFLQNIYLSIKHEEIKLKEAALPAAPQPSSTAGQKAEAASKEQQQPDLFDILAEGWTPMEGTGLGWGAFGSPYGGGSTSDSATEYIRVREFPDVTTEDSRSSSDVEKDAVEGLEYEMFKNLWNSGCLSVLRGAFEASLDLRQLEEIICGCLSLARVATILNQVAAVNIIVTELCSYFVYSVPAHSQLILAPVMYLIRRSGALLREEGWGAILELLLRLHALDLLPPSLMGLDDFEGSGGTALYSLCNLTPPPFVAPASRRDRGASRRGGGWLGDLTSILFALGDSDEESEGEDSSGMHGQLMAWPEEVNAALDGLYLLRASTDFALLPSTLTAAPRSVEAEAQTASFSYHPQVPPKLQTASQAHPKPRGEGLATGANQLQLPNGPLVDAQHEQQQQKQQTELSPPPASSNLPAEDEETAAAMAPYLRLKAVLAHGVRVDLAVAELFRQVEPISSLSIAVVLLVHILLGFPSLRQNPGAPPPSLAQQKQLMSTAAAPQDRGQSVAGGGSTAAASTTASVVSSEGPPSLQQPDDSGPPAIPMAESSMLSSYVVDAQRRGADGDNRRNSVSSGNSAASTPVGSSVPGSGPQLLSLPPPVWSPLRGGTIPPLLSYREFTDRLFCLEVLGALMLSELTPGSFCLQPSQDYGTALVQKSPWVLCAVYLDAFLRRYAIGSAAAGVPNPLEAVGLASPFEQQQQQQQSIVGGCSSSPAWVFAMLNACSKDPLALTTMRSVCSVFQAIGPRRLVETPGSPLVSWHLCDVRCLLSFSLQKRSTHLIRLSSSVDVGSASPARVLHSAPICCCMVAGLPHWELLFIERLVVTILRICLRLLSDEDSLLLPVYSQPEASQAGSFERAGCAAACQVAIHLLQLLTLLHPNVFCMHVQRIAQSAIILVSRLNLRACSSPLLIQVLLALYQRLVPLPAFAPTSPLPQQLTQQQQQQELARRVLASLSDWIKDPEALALLVLQHRNHYQMLLQTLMAFCIYTPPSPQSSTSPTSSRVEGEVPSHMQLQQQNKTEGLRGAPPYAANCTSLSLLAGLIPSIGEALQMKATAVSTRLAAATTGGAATADGGTHTWRARLDCQAMWLQALQVLAIVCSFGARPVKVKALAVLQQLLIHCSTTDKGVAASSITAPDGRRSSEGDDETLPSEKAEAASATVAAANAAVEYWAGAADDPYTWRLCLQLVVFPLLSFRFDYPYTPPAPGDAPPPPPQQQQQQQQQQNTSVVGVESVYSFPMGVDASQQQRDPNLTLPWMALPTRRRLTPEVAITTLGLDEVYQRKAAAASLACRLFLTKMEHLLRPFSPKGFYVDFSPEQGSSAGGPEIQRPSEVHPGGIEGLLPPLTQLVQLLVAEAKQAPLIYRDAFLESMKNTLLVVLTCPSVAATTIPSGLRARISPADLLPLLLQEQQRRHPHDDDKEKAEGPQGNEELGHDAARGKALLAALSCLSESQRLVVSAVSPFVSFAFPGVVQELLLILPTPQPSSCPENPDSNIPRMLPAVTEDASDLSANPVEAVVGASSTSEGVDT